MTSEDVSEKTHPTLSVKIEDLSRAGSGVARQITPEGRRVVFVPGTMVGDEVEVEITREEKRFVEAEVVRVIAPSQDRVTPRCAVFGRCGGCTWQHVPYEIQWQTKREGVRHALSRTQVEFTGVLEEFPALNPWNYRNRIQLRGSEGTVGFFARRSRALVPIERCEIAREELNRVLPSLQEKGRVRTGEYKIEIDVLPSGEVREAWNAPHAALGFRQVNDEQNARLQDFVQGAIPNGAHVLDLYGGNGNLSLSLSKRVAWVDCVDVGSPQGGDSSQPENFRFFKTDAPKWIDRRAHELGKGQWRLKGEGVVILDPPREGLGDQQNKIAGAIETIGVKQIIAVGCDPDSFARDVSRFQKRGWKLARLAAFDLFPQTPHIESVGVLQRN